MGGIFGIRYFDNRPIVDSDIDTLKSAMARWGPDGSTVWTSNGIALGHMLLFNTPEALFEDQPLQAGPLTMVAEARIDNREELSRQLEIASSELKEAPDSLLIFRAFEKWGEKCVDYLLGDWSFALWNADSKELFVARDHHGITGIHYYCDNCRIVFASSLPALLQLEWVPQKPNLDYVARVLVSWPEFGHETAFEDIHRVPPAHFLKSARSSAQTHRYWYLEHTPDIKFKTDQEYVDSFLDIYGKAVRCRLRSHRPVAAALSGGLDSGSLTAIAAHEYQKSGTQFPAYSSVPAYNTEAAETSRHIADETPYILATSQFVGNIDVNFIRAQQVSPITAIEKALHILGEPGHSAANMYWLDELMYTAHRHGIGSLFLGQGGNETISWVGLQSKPFLRYRRKPWLLVKATLKAILPSRLTLAHQLYFTNPSPWQEYSAIRREFAQELGLTRKMICAGHDPIFRLKGNPRSLRYRLIKPGRHAIGAMISEFGAQYELEIRDPTIDKRVIEFCIGVPNEQYRHDNWDRMLIRRAMDGLLPPEVVWNRRRGLQAADITRRVREVSDEAEAVLSELSQSELCSNILDLERMETILECTKKNYTLGTQTDVSVVLLRGLMTGIFLLGNEKRSHADLLPV